MVRVRATSSAVAGRTTLPGMPITTDRGGTFIPGGTTAPDIMVPAIYQQEWVDLPKGFWLDVKIIALTVAHILSDKNAY